MDAEKVGKRISEYRKAIGMTQKELAAQLHVTDGAVSKWERGINFPDIALLEPLAAILGTTVVDLLSLENASNHEVATAISDISMSEKAKLVKEMKMRAIHNIVNGIVLCICLVTASMIFKQHNIFGIAHGVTFGALGFVTTSIGSEIFMIRNIGKI